MNDEEKYLVTQLEARFHSMLKGTPSNWPGTLKLAEAAVDELRKVREDKAWAQDSFTDIIVNRIAALINAEAPERTRKTKR